jgi:hypothetical protein
MNTIILYEDYVSQQKNIKDLFLDYTTNKYIKKGSTGIGGTSVILESTDTIRIVISPTVGMIQGKELQRTSKNTYFIYGDSKDKWEDFQLNQSPYKVVNCTPEQIISIKSTNTPLFDQLVTYPIFVDEIHQFIPDSSFRPSMVEFLDILFNCWECCWTLSSATDNRLDGVLLDVPTNKVFDQYEIVRETLSKREIEVLRVHKLSTNKIKEIINQSILNGRKLLIASNNSKLHTILTQISGYNVVNLVGANIQTKLRPYKLEDDLDNICWDQVDVVIISSKYFAGFDIPLDVDVCIDTSIHSENSMIGVNDIRQIIGRPRINVGRIVLIINTIQPLGGSTDFISTIQPSGYQSVVPLLNNLLLNINISNWTTDIQLIIREFVHYQLLFAPILNEELLRYGLVGTKYKNKQIESLIELDARKFVDKLEKLVVETNERDLKNDFYRLSKFLKYKREGIFSPDLLMLFYTAIMIRRNHIDIDFTKDLKPSRLYLTLNKLFKGDTKWDLIWGYYKSKMNTKKKVSKDESLQYTKKQLQYLEVRSQPSKEIASISDTGFDCFIKTMTYLENQGIEVDDYEKSKLESRCEKIKSYQSPEDWKGLRTKNQLLNIIGWANLFLLNGGRENYNFPLNKNRSYNPLTQIPSCLRGMISVPIVEIDISSANPTFIDKLVGSQLHEIVYDRISNHFNIGRKEAKIMYNSILNNHYNKQSYVYKFFIICGYTKEQSMELSSWVVESKGSVYERMTEMEKKTIELIVEAHLGNTRWFRFHDAILMLEHGSHSVVTNLPKSVDGVELHIKNYNSGENYIEKDLFN